VQHSRHASARSEERSASRAATLPLGLFVFIVIVRTRGFPHENQRSGYDGVLYVFDFPDPVTV
jgi:hypothetical protein